MFASVTASYGRMTRIFAVAVLGMGLSMPAIAQERAAQDRDGIRGVREQHEAAARTAKQLNRDARDEARQGALDQAASDPRLGANLARDSQGDLRDVNAMNSGLRGADLGLWFNSRAGQQGLVISDVTSQGAFAQAGFRENDRIVSINGQPVNNEAQFVHMLWRPGSDQMASVVVLRNGQQHTLIVSPTAVMQGVVPVDPFYQAGLILDPNRTDQLVVQQVFPRTPAFYAGLRPGDVISGLGGRRITSSRALAQAFQGGSGADLGLVVTRNGQDRQLALNLGAGSFGADGSVRTALRPDASAIQGGAFGANTNIQTNQPLGADATLPNTSGAVGSATQAGVTSGAAPGALTAPATAGASLPANPGTAGADVDAVTTGTIGTTTNPAAGAITSPTATGNPTSPSLPIQPGGVRTATPGVPTAVPGLPTAGTTGAGTVGGTTGSMSPFAPGVNSGATGGAGAFAPGINSGTPGTTPAAGSTAGGAGAVGGTGAAGGAGASAGGAGAVGGTGAAGGTGASAGGTGAAGGSGGAGAGGSGAGGT
jgi:membrane-associated protease RseP (regulator of RpoE activity)